MFICQTCGREFSGGAVAVVGLPRPAVCPTCRSRELAEAAAARYRRRNRLELAIALVTLAAALVVLWGAYRDARRPPIETTPIETVPAAGPTPGDDGAERPRATNHKPTSQLATARSRISVAHSKEVDHANQF